MKKYISLSKALAVFIAICMIVTAMPIFASAAVTFKYIDIDDSGDEPVATFSDTPSANTQAVYLTGSSQDTYILDEDLSDYMVIINEIQVVLDEHGNIDQNMMLTSGSGYLNLGPIAYRTDGIAACPYTEPLDIMYYYMAAEPVGTFVVNDDMYLDAEYNFEKLVVSNGTLVIAAIVWAEHVVVENGASIYIEAPQSGDPNGLNICMNGSLTVETGGSITADDGQILELGTDASASGIDLYAYDGQTVDSYTPEAQHDPLDCEYSDNKWVLPNNQGQGPNSFLVQAREIYDNGGGYIGVTRSSDLQSGEQSINSGFMESYTPGETLYFHVSPPQSEENVAVKYTIMDPAGSSYQTYSVTYDSQRGGYFFDITAPQSGTLEIYVTWSQLGYEFDITEFTDGIRTEFGYYGNLADDTYVTTANSTDEMTYYNNIKAQFAQGTTQMVYHIYPGERRFLSEIRFDGVDYSRQDILNGQLPSGYTYTTGLEYDTFTVPVSNPEEMFYVYFEFEQTPSYQLYFGDQNIEVIATNGQSQTSLSPNTFYDYPQSGNLTLTFNTLESWVEFYGIVIYYNDPDTPAEYIKAEDLVNGNQYQITDFSKVISISVYETPAAFDNEMQFVYEYGQGSVRVAGDTVESNGIYSFYKNVIYFIDFIPPAGISSPYKVEMETNGSYEVQDITNDLDNNSYTLTPRTDDGITFRIYWTQEQYVYDSLVAHDNESMLLMETHGDGGAAFDSDYSAGYAEYNGTQKFITGVSSTYYAIDFNPAYGAEVERVVIDGVDYTDQVVNNRLVIPITDGGKVIWVDVSFTRVELKFDIDGNGDLESNDYAMLRAYIESSSDGSNIALADCDFNGDGGVDGLDVIFLDLYINGVIEFDGTPKQP